MGQPLLALSRQLRGAKQWEPAGSLVAMTVQASSPAEPRPSSFGLADVELAFVLAPRQNHFFVELVDTLRAEASALGARASVHVGGFPAPRADLVYVLVPPHEYFTLLHGRHGPTPHTLARTIFICAEQPDTSFFDDNLSLAPRAGAVFDINSLAVRAFRTNGIDAHHLQIGWTPGWDHLRERERDIDVLFLGSISDRREAGLARAARLFSRWRTCLILADNSLPNWHAAASFRTDQEKWDLLGRAKILLNIHQGKRPYFEWLRIAQAMSNGAVVVSEHSVDHEPLEAGRHFLSGELESLGLLCEFLLSDPDRWWRIQTDAYQTIRHELPLSAGIRRLFEVGANLARSIEVPDADDPFFTQAPPDPNEIRIFREPDRPPSPAGENHNAAVVRRALKDVKLELIDVRRELVRIKLSVIDGHSTAPVELIHRTSGYAASSPRVSILMALYNYEQHVGEALDSLLTSAERSWEVLVVDDGSSDRSGKWAQEWLLAHEDCAGLLLHHPVNMGLGHARNHALGCARGEFCFVLDADNAVYPHCLGRLLEALESDPRAAFAYGIHERFRVGEPVGLANMLPWEPSRLRLTNYIDAMALIRTSLLREGFGGYTTDRRLHGWEDYDLWCQFAEAELYGVFVPEIVARYRTTAHSMLSLTNISGTDAYSILIERYPRLMAGMQPPD